MDRYAASKIFFHANYLLDKKYSKTLDNFSKRFIHFVEMQSMLLEQALRDRKYTKNSL